jgi:CheY-like chemotaxis protein
MEILIVDDERTATAVHGAYVRKVANCKAVCFGNPQEALDWAAKHHPAIVIVDYLMPVMDGTEFTRRFRRLPGKNHTPVLMVTDFDHASVRELALSAGVDEFLTKPVDRATLTSCILNLSAARPTRRDAAVSPSEPHDFDAIDPAALDTILTERDRRRAVGGGGPSGHDSRDKASAALQAAGSEEILILDDEPTSTALLACYVRRFKCSPTRFGQATQALAWCQTHEPAAVIVDYMMPDMDGLEFIRRFRMLPGKADIPVVMVSAYGDSLLKQAALAAGVSEFLQKPVDATNLAMRLQTLLAARALRKRVEKDERL